MASNSGGYTKSQMKTLTKNLDSEVSKFNKAVKQLNKDLTELQKGTGSVSYWSGALAYNWIKAALCHVDHDKVLLDHLDNCSEYLANLVYGGDNL